MSNKNFTVTTDSNLSARDMVPADFRRYGHDAIDWIATYLEYPRRFPVLTSYSPGTLQSELPVEAPRTGESMEAILKDFEQVVLPAVTHWNHPHFHAYFSISASAPGILGELFTSALNVNAMLWKSCPAATELEQTMVAWVLDWLGLPSRWFGMIVDSASSAVLQAVVAARQKAEPESRSVGPSGRLVAYISEHTHSSVEKAAIASGIGQSNVRHIAVDRQFRMCPDALAEAIASDRARGLAPFFVAATVGTTSSAAIDPVPEIAAICRTAGLWLHVDGAYGGMFGALPECKHVLDGVEHADSFVVNAHKLLMVPLDCSLFYTGHPDLLRSAFSMQPEYLKTDAATVDFMDYGVALGRRFRALKLWFVMRYFGLDRLAAILRENVKMADWLAEQISVHPRFQLVTPADMGLVCFRIREGDAHTRELSRRINGSGRFFVSHTVLEGRFVIRVAIGNIRTRQQDIEELWVAIKNIAEALEPRSTRGDS